MLAANTVAFTVCFAVWVLYGALVTFLVESGVYDWSRSQIGVLIGVPVLSGALMRLPVGALCDLYGGRIVYFLLMLAAAIPTFLVASADRYVEFLLAGLGFGVSGASFAAGVAYTAAWFPRERVGTALGIFGIGNVGAALTAMFAPLVLMRLTGNSLDDWRTLPRLYAALLVVTAVLFWLATTTRVHATDTRMTARQRLAPLARVRVWRFGLYYAFYFGGFVALSQWLIPYYVSVYSMSVAKAGFLTSLFALPSGLFRAVGGWMSDRWGARTVMYGTLVPGLVLCILLFPAAMVIHTPGKGITAAADDSVVRATAHEVALASGGVFQLEQRNDSALVDFTAAQHLVLPRVARWQEPVVQSGQRIRKGDLIARGTTRIFFQANRLVFTGLVFLLGCTMGIGMAAVFKHIPMYFPGEVGIVGGLVGVLGGLGGFVFPVVFGVLLDLTGLWTTTWMLLAALAAICLIWMQRVIQRMMRDQTGDLSERVEHVARA